MTHYPRGPIALWLNGIALGVLAFGAGVTVRGFTLAAMAAPPTGRGHESVLILSVLLTPYLMLAPVCLWCPPKARRFWVGTLPVLAAAAAITALGCREWLDPRRASGLVVFSQWLVGGFGLVAAVQGWAVAVERNLTPAERACRARWCRGCPACQPEAD